MRFNNEIDAKKFKLRELFLVLRVNFSTSVLKLINKLKE